MVDDVGLDVLISYGVLRMRECKMCLDDQGIVRHGEFGIGASDRAVSVSETASAIFWLPQPISSR